MEMLAMIIHFLLCFKRRMRNYYSMAEKLCVSKGREEIGRGRRGSGAQREIQWGKVCLSVCALERANLLVFPFTFTRDIGIAFIFTRVTGISFNFTRVIDIFPLLSSGLLVFTVLSLGILVLQPHRINGKECFISVLLFFTQGYWYMRPHV